MGKYFVDNLCIVLTNRCNLNCGHCLRGKKSNINISKEVIDQIFNQICGTSLLNICGGEPLLALDELEYLFDTIIKRKIHVSNIAITINGTVYDKRFEDILDKMSTYLKDSSDGNVFFAISLDKYHDSEMDRLGLSIDERLIDSKYFYEFRRLGKNKLFREGNAELLDSSLTVPLRVMEPIICDLGNKYEHISHIIGPLICINVNGTITEDNTTLDKQESLYNYGNILDEDIVLALQRRGFKTFKYELLYNISSSLKVKKYLTYNK